MRAARGSSGVVDIIAGTTGAAEADGAAGASGAVLTTGATGLAGITGAAGTPGAIEITGAVAGVRALAAGVRTGKGGSGGRAGGALIGSAAVGATIICGTGTGVVAGVFSTVRTTWKEDSTGAEAGVGTSEEGRLQSVAPSELGAKA